MSFNADLLTQLLKRALDILFLSNPFRTSMGFLLGVILGGFSPIFSQYIQLDLSSIHPVVWVSLGVFTVNLKALVVKPKISRKAEEALALIEAARKAGLTDLEIKQKYRDFVQKYADNVALNQEMRQELEKMKRRLRRMD